MKNSWPILWPKYGHASCLYLYIDQSSTLCSFNISLDYLNDILRSIFISIYFLKNLKITRWYIYAFLAENNTREKIVYLVRFIKFLEYSTRILILGRWRRFGVSEININRISALNGHSFWAFFLRIRNILTNTYPHT